MWLPDVITSTPAAKSASAVDAVRPMPPATFSPLAVTKSMPRSSRIPASSRSTARRPGFPITSPIIRIRHAPGGRGALPFGGLPSRVRLPAAESLEFGVGLVILRRGYHRRGSPPRLSCFVCSTLLRVLDGARLADDRDLDLARVGQVVLDLLDDVASEAGRREVVDLVRADEDPDLAARLDGERPLDAGEAVGDALQVLEALD